MILKVKKEKDELERRKDRKIDKLKDKKVKK
jgi:hypothetical protein